MSKVDQSWGAALTVIKKFYNTEQFYYFTYVAFKGVFSRAVVHNNVNDHRILLCKAKHSWPAFLLFTFVRSDFLSKLLSDLVYLY